MSFRFAAFVAFTTLVVSSGVAVASESLVHSSATVNVAMKEWGLSPKPTSAKAGKITFVVKNTGFLKHEFLVLKTNTKANKLPQKGTTAVVSGLIGKIAQYKGGLTKTLSLTLKPGHYILLCNVPAHYKAGQHVDFTVH